MISSQNLGFMQGRLSPMIDGMIQRFPVTNWQNELEIAKLNNWNLMEWTIDYYSFDKNPLINKDFKSSSFSKIQIPSITADFFMQKPFFLEENSKEKNLLINDFKKVLDTMIKLNIRFIVLPLVDNASIINNNLDENLIIDCLRTIFLDYEKYDIEFIFESDFNPKRLLGFIEKFHLSNVGINYDSGNSASLGFDSDEEFSTYGIWIKNCHLKDRIIGGSTVEFGKGHTDFKKVLSNFKKINYKNNFIIQGARANDSKHLELLDNYREFIYEILNNGI